MASPCSWAKATRLADLVVDPFLMASLPTESRQSTGDTPCVWICCRAPATTLLYRRGAGGSRQGQTGACGNQAEGFTASCDSPGQGNSDSSVALGASWRRWKSPNGDATAMMTSIELENAVVQCRVLAFASRATRRPMLAHAVQPLCRSRWASYRLGHSSVSSRRALLAVEQPACKRGFGVSIPLN